MLSRLHIENIAVIEKTEIDFTGGLTILTGETGAGKSIVIDALQAILGMRTSRELIRTGASSAKVMAVFCNLSETVKNLLDELGYEADDELLLHREISETKNTCRVNGLPATTAVLREIGQALINIHGQHENQALLNVERHIAYLDALGDWNFLLQDYTGAYEQMTECKRKLSETLTDEQEKNRRIELLEYQINELTDADIKEGEWDELNRRKDICQNREQVAASLFAANQYLFGDEDASGALSLLTSAVNSFEEAMTYLEKGEDTAEKIRECLYNLQEYADEISGFMDSSEYDEEDINAIEERLDILYKLKRKYGSDEAEMLAFLENAAEELEGIRHSEEQIAALTKQLADLEKKAKDLAENLTNVRKKGAKRFVQDVTGELMFLNMPNLQFEVRMLPKELGPIGADDVEFLISANAGEAPKSIAKIASGGELSRIMLAIKNVLAGQDDIATLIFDEIDTGMSGTAAERVGRKLKQVSKGRQVVCVTHLAQIAALADCHLHIEKEVKNNRTYTNVSRLPEDDRVQELAHMSVGENITVAALENAREMLRYAGSTET